MNPTKEQTDLFAIFLAISANVCLFMMGLVSKSHSSSACLASSKEKLLLYFKRFKF